MSTLSKENKSKKFIKVAVAFNLKSNSNSAKGLQKSLVRLIIASAYKHYLKGKSTAMITAYITNMMNLNKNNKNLGKLISEYDLFAHSNNNNNKINQARGLDNIANYIFKNYWEKMDSKSKGMILFKLPEKILLDISGRVLNIPINNRNVTTWMNRNMTAVNKNNINVSKRVFLQSNVNTNGKIRSVYNKNGLINWLSKSNNISGKQTSPLTRKLFGMNNIKIYPPKKLIRTN